MPAWWRTRDFLFMEEGVFSKPLNRFSLSVAHTDGVLRRTDEAFARSFKALRGLDPGN